VPSNPDNYRSVNRIYREYAQEGGPKAFRLHAAPKGKRQRYVCDRCGRTFRSAVETTVCPVADCRGPVRLNGGNHGSTT
jgi:hypothetical protein